MQTNEIRGGTQHQVLELRNSETGQQRSHSSAESKCEWLKRKFEFEIVQNAFMAEGKDIVLIRQLCLYGGQSLDLRHQFAIQNVVKTCES